MRAQWVFLTSLVHRPFAGGAPAQKHSLVGLPEEIEQYSEALRAVLLFTTR
jgi:hypothetical protein